MKFRLLLCLQMLVLYGCATMSAEECATADWRAFGYEDGTRGETLVMASKRAQACSKHGASMDHDAYHLGRHEGLNSFCTPGTGYRLGESGKEYSGVCTDHSEEEFLQAYDRGFELFGFTSAVDTATARLREVENRYAQLNRELQKYAEGYRDEELTTREHNDKVLDIWSERKWLATEAIPYWQVELRYAQRELEGYQQKVAAGIDDAGSLSPRGFAGPRPYPGPTQTDAQEMLSEVFGRRD